MTAPPLQIGERLLPARARPVPFWRQGFFPPPLTKARVFVAAVPARRFACCIRTVSYSRWRRTGWLNTAAGKAISPTTSLRCDTTGIVIASATVYLLDCRPDQHQAVSRPGNAAAHQHEVLCRPDLDHFQVLGGVAFITVLPGHALAFQHAAWVRPVTNRPAVAEVLVCPVTARKTGDPVALDDARKAAPFGGSGHIHAITHLENALQIDFLPNRVGLTITRAKLAQHTEDSLACFHAVVTVRLRRALSLLVAEPNLDACVAVARGGLRLHHRTRAGVDNGHG